MKIRQHIPAFCEGFSPEEKEFSSLKELLNIPFVSSWSDTKKYSDFYRYSLSPYYDHKYLLMAEFKKGSEWWVVGTIPSLDEKIIKLPIWKVPDNHNKGSTI